MCPTGSKTHETWQKNKNNKICFTIQEEKKYLVYQTDLSVIYLHSHCWCSTNVSSTCCKDTIGRIRITFGKSRKASIWSLTFHVSRKGICVHYRSHQTCKVMLRSMVGWHSNISSVQQPEHLHSGTQAGTYMYSTSSGNSRSTSTSCSMGRHMLLASTSMNPITTTEVDSFLTGVKNFQISDEYMLVCHPYLWAVPHLEGVKSAKRNYLVYFDKKWLHQCLIQSEITWKTNQC